ncbi:MAG: hypothetical protein AB7K52_13785 [Phycisphaerales bacterium]
MCTLCRCLAGAAALLTFGSLAAGQVNGLALPTGGVRQPVYVYAPPPDPSSPEQKAATEFNLRKRLATKELSRIRLKHFGAIERTEIRQAGIIKVRAFTEAPALAAMVDVFRDEGADIRAAVLDHLADRKNDAGDAALAWAAVFDPNPVFRGEAAERVSRRVRESGSVPITTQEVIATGLTTGKAAHATAAGRLANILRLVDAIPMMAAAQAGPSGGYYGGQPDTPDESLAYILVGTQRTFVADLTPVVGESAVAFDPQIGVITEGVILRVINAFVFEFNGDLHQELVSLSSKAWGGRETAHLGWDAKAWQRWYDTELKPYLVKQDEERAARAREAARASGPDGPA